MNYNFKNKITTPSFFKLKVPVILSMTLYLVFTIGFDRKPERVLIKNLIYQTRSSFNLYTQMLSDWLKFVNS